MKPQENAHNHQTHLTITELAALWRVSPSLIRRAIWHGTLAVMRFGRCVRIPLEEAERFARERTAKKTNPRSSEEPHT